LNWLAFIWVETDHFGDDVRKKMHATQYCDVLLLCGLVVFLFSYFSPHYLLLDTVITGGDAASWQGVADHLANVLIPNGRLTGWDMGNFCGYPNFVFYFLPPFLLAAFSHLVFGFPLAVTIKWAVMSGIFLLPVTAFFGLKRMKYRFPVPIMGAFASLLFMFNESYTMFGGNTLSTFVGEFCYMFAFAVFAYFIGSFYHGTKTGTGAISNGILLGLIGLSHLFIFIPALLLLIAAFFYKTKTKYLFKVAITCFMCMAFWILPLVAYRHPYTTPVYMIWQSFTHVPAVLAGLLILFVLIGPVFSLLIITQKEIKYYPLLKIVYSVFSGIGIFTGTFLALKYLLFGNAMWDIGFNTPSYDHCLLPSGLAVWLDRLLWPFSALIGVGIAASRMWAAQNSAQLFALFSRIIGAISLIILLFFSILFVHPAIIGKITDSTWQIHLMNPLFMAIFYGPILIGLFIYLIFSRHFARCMAQMPRINLSRLSIWLWLISGCVVAYFAAHFLQVPDIRFLPPILYALMMLFIAETLGPFLTETGRTLSCASAVTFCYSILIIALFIPEKADSWYRNANRGYELKPGYSDFAKVNRFLKTTYDKEGLNPLNAPRVAYEKCNLYGAYGGDRVFESLCYFSGRQTLEGIHYAGSIASRFIAFLQTEFSKEIKTPAALILSKINPEALPAHFDLYNISQVIVMTGKIKQALSRSPAFYREAEFGAISVFRYKDSRNQYVEIPKHLPLLYTGEQWVDDFYARFKNIKYPNVLVVPDAYVKNPEDRSVFAEPVHSLDDPDALKSEVLNIENAQIQTNLTHLTIRFKTNRIGIPHLVKVSYFPNWKVKGASGVYPVSPHFMMVIPRKSEVVLTYGRSAWDIIGMAITITGFLWICVFICLRFSGRSISLPEKAMKLWNKFWEHTEHFVALARPWIFLLIILVSIVLIISGAWLRNRPVNAYISGHNAYSSGVRHAARGETAQAEARFRKAIALMRPIIENRSQYDHQDIINCLLFTGMCHENLKQDDQAEANYRTVLNEYPYSRYVAEGYVKIAQIRKRQMRIAWEQGMRIVRQENTESGKPYFENSLDFMNQALDTYEQAILKEPYSVWAGHAKKYLGNEAAGLRRLLNDMQNMAGASQFILKMENLIEKQGNISKNLPESLSEN